MGTISKTKLFILSVLSVSFFLPTVFYSFNTFPKAPETTEFYQQSRIESNLNEGKLLLMQKERKPIVFSKFKYLNQTRKVWFSSSSPFSVILSQF